MKITRFVRMQLMIFAIVTVVAMAVMALFYIRIPSMFGVGSYQVQLLLPTSGGLYQNANVSYRGVYVGKVDSVRLTDTGVEATLTIENDADIPASSTASVRSVSAIGEQFVEFTPDPGAGSPTNTCRTARPSRPIRSRSRSRRCSTRPIDCSRRSATPACVR